MCLKKCGHYSLSLKSCLKLNQHLTNIFNDTKNFYKEKCVEIKIIITIHFEQCVKQCTFIKINLLLYQAGVSQGNMVGGVCMS